MKVKNSVKMGFVFKFVSHLPLAKCLSWLSISREAKVNSPFEKGELCVFHCNTLALTDNSFQENM